MPKTKRQRQSEAEAEACASFPIQSPVPGVHIELASHLIQAIKVGRRFLSKSASLAQADEDLLQNLQNTADDKTTAFLNELRRQAERSSASTTKTSSGRNRTTAKPSASTHCLEFLLEIVSDGSNNSFHLRRSALALVREILDRSSDSRAFFASGRCLLDFVSVIEGVEISEVGEEERVDVPTNSSNIMSSDSLFQLEAMELIHHLASKFGNFYTQFTVASRLLGDVSVNFFSMNANSNHTSNNNDTQAQAGGSHRSRRVNMQILRRERDVALECGPKVCQSLRRMLERADAYFHVLVPRFGGFNYAPLGGNDKADDDQVVIETQAFDVNAAIDSKEPAKECEGNDGEDDEDSINWEEGDFGLSVDDNLHENILDIPTDLNNEKSYDHEASVEETMDIMARGGALLDGKLAVQVGAKSIDAEPASIPAGIPVGTATASVSDAQTQALLKLQNLVKKLSTRRLPRLNQWIHALSHADGMQERAVIDPATAAVSGNEGPTSLVLLSEGKRTMRSQLLQKLMKLRSEIEGVLRSAATLGISSDGDEKKKKDDGNTSPPPKREGNKEEAQVKNNGTSEESRTEMVHSWMHGKESLNMASRRKKPKTSRFKVIYRK
eukprot:CAMPEP_0183707092 /NCGR_PEP_ID=MMETSP0737-20130205/3749_1 /TAXON_ID=385413 /ORGANISM="Thalassiosira miniscula, Strain CCMP1093" /LENGTH=610 /DNA_ID=CAMNT_0025934667 /DNA_START=83 /DNA_END=1915 /DNA_ORIENTATION=+